MDDEMTQEEVARYRFRVGRMHFEAAADAIRYAEANLYATHIDLRWPDGVWRRFWTDGDIVYNRPGFGCLVS